MKPSICHALRRQAEGYGAPASGEPLAPLLAGARARGVADGLEWLGLAAVLLDDRGEVLHVNRGAVDLMGEDLFLQADACGRATRAVDARLLRRFARGLAGGVASRLAIPSDRGGRNWAPESPRWTRSKTILSSCFARSRFWSVSRAERPWQAAPRSPLTRATARVERGARFTRRRFWG